MATHKWYFPWDCPTLVKVNHSLKTRRLERSFLINGSPLRDWGHVICTELLYSAALGHIHHVIYHVMCQKLLLVFWLRRV